MSERPTLLLVEDSETQALQFRLLLEAEGFAVDRTPTAEAALDRLNHALPDLLVVDYRLPGMNGDELVRRVRQSRRTRTLPVLMLTEAEAPDLERQGLDSGANAYVPKAAEPALLFSRVRALIRQRRSDAPTEATEDAFRPARIVLIDRDGPQRRLFRGLLSGEGYALELGERGPALEARLEAGGIDCVLVELAEDGREGLALCRTLDLRRATGRGGYEIVAFAERADDEMVLAGFAAGADDVIARLDDSEMLLVRLRAIIRRKFARDEETTAANREREREATLERARAEAEAAEALAAANAELAAANQRLHETQNQLVQAAKMASLGELVAGIAHEINNPLAFIIAHHQTIARLVRETVESCDGAGQARLGRALDRLESMRGGLTRIQELVVKLRRFSRLDEGDLVHIDVPEAIEAVLTLLAPRLTEGIEVSRDYRAPPMLLCQAALINQVVMNIIANAADVLGPAGGRIRIATREADDRYVIEIGDSGPGIPPEMRERLFEPFFTTKDVGAGTGLGLAIAYGVVRAHGGDIEIGDSEDGGALFTIAVPIRAVP